MVVDVHWKINIRRNPVIMTCMSEINNFIKKEINMDIDDLTLDGDGDV